MPATAQDAVQSPFELALQDGVAAFRKGDTDIAIKHFQRATELDPQSVNARLYLAASYASQFVLGVRSEKNLQVANKALRAFEAVLILDPVNLKAHKNIASIYFNLKEWEEAKEIRRRLIELDPDNPEHYYAIGVIDWTQTYPERMAARKTSGIQNQPDIPLHELDRIELEKKNGPVVEEAIEALKEALKMNPEYLKAIAYLNLMYREKADLVPTMLDRQKWLKKADQMVELHKQIRLKRKSKETQTRVD